MSILCYEMFTIFINFLTVMTVCHVFTGEVVEKYRKEMYLITGEMRFI
jgi:hypothetical protein